MLENTKRNYNPAKTETTQPVTYSNKPKVTNYFENRHESPERVEAIKQIRQELRCAQVHALPPRYVKEKEKAKQRAKELGKVKTRRQMTEDRIAENVKKFNDPSGMSNSMFDFHLMGTQAASNFSQYTTDQEMHVLQTESEHMRKTHIQDVLSRSDANHFELSYTVSRMQSQRGVDKETSPELDTHEDDCPPKRYEAVQTAIMQPDMVSKTIYGHRNANTLKGSVVQAWQ